MLLDGEFCKSTCFHESCREQVPEEPLSQSPSQAAWASSREASGDSSLVSTLEGLADAGTGGGHAA